MLDRLVSKSILGCRLMVGHQVLVLSIEVRILAPQPTRARLLCLRYNIMDINSVKQIISFLNLLNMPYVIHAGFGMHLRGFSSELDDIDIKVYSDNLDYIYEEAKKYFKSIKVEKVIGESCSFGRYMFERIEIDTKIPVDICTKTGVEKEYLGKFEFPYSLDIFKNPEIFDFNGIKIPVASTESMFLYYLILDRDEKDLKNDKQKVKEIIRSQFFDENKFFELLSDHSKKDLVFSLYKKLF